jgi:hypothetical protein
MWLDVCIRILRAQLFVTAETRDNPNLLQQSSSELWCVHRMEALWYNRPDMEWKWARSGKRFLQLTQVRSRVFVCVRGGGGAGGILRPVLELLQVWAGLRSKSESGDTRWSTASEYSQRGTGSRCMANVREQVRNAGSWCFWSFQTLGMEERAEKKTGPLWT